MRSGEMLPCKYACRQRGPRRLDVQQSAKITEQSLHRYQIAALPFANFLGDRFPDLLGPEDFDDALVEFKQGATVSKANFEKLVAAVEHPFPKFRGQLPWAHDVINGVGDRAHASPHHADVAGPRKALRGPPQQPQRGEAGRRAAAAA